MANLINLSIIEQISNENRILNCLQASLFSAESAENVCIWGFYANMFILGIFILAILLLKKVYIKSVYISNTCIDSTDIFEYLRIYSHSLLIFKMKLFNTS